MVIANVCFNYRDGENKDALYFDDMLYKERYSIERTNAWVDSFIYLLNRFDTTIASWKSLNYIAFIVLLMRKVKKSEKPKWVFIIIAWSCMLSEIYSPPLSHLTIFNY